MFDSILVSLVRSFTEFIAVGSSGHTILLLQVFHVGLAPGADVAVRAGMVVSVILAFRSDLWAMARSLMQIARHPSRLSAALRDDIPLREFMFLVVGTVPAAVLGLWYGAQLSTWGTDLKLVSTFVIIGGLMLFLTRLFRRTQPRPLSVMRVLVMGLGQALAIIPGLPRMAAAMSAGVYAGVAPAVAARFSVLMALPALLGVLLVGWGDGTVSATDGPTALTLAAVFVSSAGAGWLGIQTLIGAMRTGAIRYIALYCLLIGLLGIIFL